VKKLIKIEVYGGCVTEVTGLPEGWEYEIVDYDHQEALQEEELQASSGKRQAPSHKLATIEEYNN
tara:strand:- start:175 stop:369 length:195 start_codon:yes stop_codon:yes gene_type:complete